MATMQGKEARASGNGGAVSGKKRPASSTSRNSDLESEFNRSGERQRLNEIMHRRLSESGWMNKVKQLCEESVTKKGSERITVEEIINEVRDPARRMVPDDVKRELMEHIRKFVTDKTS